jgi:AraC-like DNA-binding protein
MGVHAAELCDASVDLRDILHGAEAVRDALRVLARAPASAHSLTQLASALGGQAPTTTPAALREATYRLAREPQRTSVESMARQVGVSRQQLARLFARHVGLTPKQFSRICRVRSMLASTRERFAGWSRTAAEWGYTDQSHLIADVRAVTGQTPAQWRLAARTTPAIEPVPAKRQ